MYDPGMGRFLTEDPVKDGLNWYTYCYNNPANMIDPGGLDAIFITDQNAVGIGAPLSLGHTSVILQDLIGQWWYFYWGQNTAAYAYIPDEYTYNMRDLNMYLNSSKMGNARYRGVYTQYAYVEGDFVDGLTWLAGLINAANAMNTKKNELYDPLTNNCSQTSVEAMRMGILPNGSSFGDFISVAGSVIPVDRFWDIAVAALKSGYGWWGVYEECYYYGYEQRYWQEYERNYDYVAEYERGQQRG